MLCTCSTCCKIQSALAPAASDDTVALSLWSPPPPPVVVHCKVDQQDDAVWRREFFAPLAVSGAL